MRALLRLVIVTTLGYACAILLPSRLGIAAHRGAAGLTASAGVTGWIEFALLHASLNRRIGPTGLPRPRAARLWLSAGAAGSGAFLAGRVLPPFGPLAIGAIVLPLYGCLYLGLAALTGVPLPGLRRH
jgi:putative peptidoglycan lipid II flippase